jgi:hypothetical protein
MAEHIKFRLTAAKASVTLAFLALVGGLVGPAEGEQRGPSAQPASFQWGDPIYLKLTGLNGATHKAFQTLEYKMNQALTSLSHKISTSFYDKHKLDTTFLKIDKANQEFLKIDAANAAFLKIDDANKEYYKIQDANASFLKIDGTAANASKLGGLTPDAFVQGHANVVSAAMTLAVDGSVHPLMQTADGAILIGLTVNGDGLETIVVHNGTSSPISGVADPTAVEFSAAAGGDANIVAGSTLLPTGQAGGALMTHIQIFPNESLRDVITVTVSSESQSDRQVTAVGQMLVGSL